MKITKGKQKGVLKTLIYGEPGVGKTSFAAMRPDCIFLGDEPPKQFDVDALEGIEMTFKGVLEAAKLIKDKPYKCVVIDTIGGVEQALVNEMLGPVNTGVSDDKKSSIHTFGRGFGAGQQVLLHKLSEIVDMLEQMPKLEEIIFVAHMRVRTIELPGGIKINKIVPAIETKVIEWLYRRVDCMLYIDIMRQTTQLQKGLVNETKRVVYTDGTELFMAKNRFGLKPAYPFTGRKAVAAIYEDINKLYHKEVNDD